jgi:hypothetical protein
MTVGLPQPYEVPHACESLEVARLLAELTPRQRRVLREYVWKVELGETNVTEWLHSAVSPVSERAWYGTGKRANYLHSEAFQKALDAYRRAGQKWVLAEEQKQVARARASLVRAAPKAAERLVEQAEADMSGLFKIGERWTEFPLPSQEIIDEKAGVDEHDKPITLYLVRQVCLDLEKLTDPRYARMVKKFTDSPKNGLGIELHDAQHAVESILDRVDKATASKGSVAHTGEDGGALEVHLQREIKGLSDDQLDELIRNIQAAKGPAGNGDAGATPAPSGD